MKWIDTEAPKAAMATLNRVSGVTLWDEMIRDRRDFCLNKTANMLVLLNKSERIVNGKNTEN